VRHSTPLQPGFAPRVTSRASPLPAFALTALACSSAYGAAASSRQPFTIVPRTRSRAYQPPPAKSSHASRCKVSRFAASGASPRERCSMESFTPSPSANAGRLCQSLGTSDWRGSTCTALLAAVTRRCGSAA
jgi:hypothetical protein